MWVPLISNLCLLDLLDVLSVIVSRALPSITGFCEKTSSRAIDYVLSTPMRKRLDVYRRPVMVACMYATDSLLVRVFDARAWER